MTPIPRCTGYCRRSALALATAALFVSVGFAAEEIPTASPEEVGMSAEGLGQIDALFERHIESGTLQGAVAVVARRGKIVHFKSYGVSDVGAGKPMKKDAIFRMASSSKPVLGVAAMIAIEEGLISASDPVEKHLPEFRDLKVAVLKEPADEDISPEWVWGDVPEHRLVPAKRPITIHDLLTHTAGLGTSGLGTALAGDVKKKGDWDSLESGMATYSAMALDFQPGTRWAYSGGVGHDVVARILEVVTDTPYDQFVKERIFDPLGMVDTHFFVPDEKEPRRVVIDGIDGKGKGWDKPSRYVSASAGLSSTAADYLRFELMLLGKGSLFGRRILSEDSVARMSSNQVGDLYGQSGKEKGSGFGYTVSVVVDAQAAGGGRGVGTFGWAGAFGTMSWTDPSEDLVAVYMAQQPTKEVPAEFELAIRQAIVD